MKVLLLCLCPALSYGIINLQISNEFGDGCYCPLEQQYCSYCDGDHMDMTLDSNDTYAGKLAVKTGGTSIAHGGNRAIYTITPDGSDADIVMHWKNINGWGSENIEVVESANATATNVTVSTAWGAYTQYACQIRGPAANPTWIITFCDLKDTRDLCKSDGTCTMWPKPNTS